MGGELRQELSKQLPSRVLLLLSSPTSGIAEDFFDLAYPLVPPPNEAKGEAKLSWKDFAMGGIGGVRNTSVKTYHFGLKCHGCN